ncbi:MAG: YidB family protein [Burkholderiaceae bacterium]
MGLLDSIVGQVSGALAGAAPGAGQVHPGLLEVVTSMLSSPPGSGAPGLQGLVQQFEQQGLGHLVQSWIGTGANLAITPEQVQAVLGEPRIQAVASKLGLSAADVANQLAGLLPHAVDAATPDGSPASGNVLSEALNAFAALRR